MTEEDKIRKSTQAQTRKAIKAKQTELQKKNQYWINY